MGIVSDQRTDHVPRTRLASLCPLAWSAPALIDTSMLLSTTQRTALAPRLSLCARLCEPGSGQRAALRRYVALAVSSAATDSDDPCGAARPSCGTSALRLGSPSAARSIVAGAPLAELDRAVDVLRLCETVALDGGS